MKKSAHKVEKSIRPFLIGTILLILAGAALASNWLGVVPFAEIFGAGASAGSVTNAQSTSPTIDKSDDNLTIGTCDTAGPIEVESSGGTTTPTAYATLKDAFDAINAGTHTGTIGIDVCGSTTETASSALNSGAVAPASYTSVTMRPVGAGRVIEGSIIGAIVKLNGADNVTIDGRQGGTGSARDLTVRNNNTSAATAAIWLASVAAGNGASGNVIRNLEIAGGTDTSASSNSSFGIIMCGTTISSTANGVDNDNNSFIANRIVKVRYGITTRGTTTDLNINPVVTDNIIGPAAFGTDQIGKVGIFMQADTGGVVSRNTVQFVGCLDPQACTGADRVGIGIGSESWSLAPGTITSNSYTVTKNIIHDLVEETTFSSVGINLGTTGGGSATNNLVANNFIYNVRANGTSGDQAVGLGIAGGHTDRVVFNSISMTGDVDPGVAGASTNFGSGIRIGNASSATHANLTLSNNSVYMDLSSSSTAGNRYYAISGNATGYSFGTGGQNNNNLFINTANTQTQTGGLGTVSGSTLTTQFATLANWQAAYTAPQDAASIQADPQYISNTADLHIAGGSPNVNAGVAIAGVIDDIDGQLRVAAPDIGADEPGGLTPPPNDISATAIVTPANGSTRATGVAFAPQASFLNIGTNVQTNVTVRFKIIDGASATVYDQTAVIASINPSSSTTVTFPSATVSMAGAYTTSATSELAGDQNTSNDTVTGTVTFSPPLAGSINVGTGETVTSLTNTGGLFETINTVGASSNLTINITSNLTGETGTVALNEIAGGFTVTIKPSGAARTISGSSATGLLGFNGTDGVTIDGSLSGGTDRSLTIAPTNAGTTGGGIYFASGAAGAQNNVVKNVNVNGAGATTGILLGISFAGNTFGGVGADNDNNRVENCSVTGAFYGIASLGASAANKDTGVVITKNVMPGTGTAGIGRVGIYVVFADGAQITENNVASVSNALTADAIGIAAGGQALSNAPLTSGGLSNSVISRNYVGVVSQTNTFSAAGIVVASDVTGTNTVDNNMITGVTGNANAGDIVAGVYINGLAGSTQNVYHNSVSMTGDRLPVTANMLPSYALAIATDQPTNVVNNALFNSQTRTGSTGGGGESYAIGFDGPAANVNLLSNFNDLFVSGPISVVGITGDLTTAAQTTAAGTGTNRATLAAWQTATTEDANSVSADPLFVSLTNLHLGAGSPLLNVGAGTTGIVVDFDGDTRPSGAASEIGADEIDVAAPDTTILTGPPATSNSASATFTFSGTDPLAPEAVAGFECKLDAGAFAACTSPQSYTGLSQGLHTFSVRAVDGAGNVDPTPASYAWNVDAIAPETQILTQPTDPSSSANATFTFSGTDSFGSSAPTFQCKLDAAAFAPCTSPQTYTGLADGSHNFQVRAIDTVGNIDPSPASYTWTIATGPAGPVTVTATAGTATGVYTNLTAAVAAINAGTHQGAIVVSVNQSVTEPASVVLHSTGAGPAIYTSVLIRPTADNLTVSGASIQGRGLIELNGADNVTIDGDNPNSAGTNRDLTLQNTAASTVTFASVVRIAVAATVVTSADGNTIKNLKILGNATGRNIPAAVSTTASENTTFGIFAGPNASTVSATTDPSALTSVSASVAAGATATNLSVSNNEVMSVARAISMNGAATTVFPGLTISSNRIGNPTAGAPDQVYSIGITAQGSANAIIADNTVWIEGYIPSSVATHGINVGVNSALITGATIERNRVNRIKQNNPQTWSAYGINLGGGANHIVQNNFISGVINDQTAGTGGFGTAFGAYGIRVGSGTGHKIYHNSVNLYGAMGGTTSTNLTAAFLLLGNTLTGVDVRNNIFANRISGGNPIGTRNVAVFLPSAATVALNLTWNNNAYYVGSDVLNRLAQTGTTFGAGEFQTANFDPNSTTPASNFRAYTSTLSAAGTNDNASFATTAVPPYTSDVDLHIPAATATRLESGGAAVGVTTDIDTESRSATTPDIGADEFAGSPAPPNDMAAGVFVSPLNGANVPTGASFAPQATFVNQGTATQTNVTVRYRIIDSSMTTVYNQTATIATIAPLQNVAVTFPNTTLTVAGVYTIQATAELAGDTNSSNDQITGTINALVPFSGTINVGTGETFTSLTNAGGIFQALNNAGISGNTTILITSDLTAETGAVFLNQLAEAGVGGYTVTFRPSGAARTISGTAAVNIGLITLNGADRIVFDGSLGSMSAPGGSDRSLTITNNQLGTSTVIWNRSANASNGATNNRFENLIITGGVGATQTTAGILTGSGVTIGNDAEAANSGTVVNNCWIYRVQNSLYLRGGLTAPVFDQNVTVTNNEFGSTVQADRNAFRGMLIGNSANFTITGNRVLGIRSTATTTAFMHGIHMALLLNNGNVANNVIADVKNVSATGTGAAGITVGSTSTASNVAIVNNFVSDVAANGSATIANNGSGLAFLGSGTGYSVYHNSVNLTTNQTTAQTSAAMFVNSTFATAGALNVRNNVFANNQTTGARYGVYSLAAASVFTNINGNDYFAQNVGFIGGSARATLVDWQTATTQDANSLAVDPLFVSATDLHLQPSSTLRNAGVTGTGVTLDIDGFIRDATPDIGADELPPLVAPGTVQFDSATYSVGEAGGTVTLTLTRTNGSSGAISATYGTASGTATGGATCGAGVDYVSITGGTANWADGDSAPKTFAVTICNDAAFEGNENFTASISGTTGGAVIGAPNPATVTITDDDPAPTGTITINDVRIDEGNTGGANAVFTVTYTGVSAATASVNFATASGTALSGVDFLATSGTLNFSSGTSLTVTVPIIGKTLKEANETFFVNLSNPVNATITDNQGLGIIIDEDRAYVSDFDRDLAADLSIFRPSEGKWYVFRSASLSPLIVPFGSNGDRPVPGDYDGDGLTDLAVFRPSESKWYVTNSTNNSVVTTAWGMIGDKPVQADYDGDGKTDIAIFRPSEGKWWIIRSSDSVTYTVNFGISTDLPMQGDYDGDFKTDQAVYRNGVWYALLSSNSSVQIVNFGLATDKPVSGDFDGDGKYDAAIFRNGDWWVLSSLTGTASFVHWGLPGDIPVPADFDADGTTDIAIYRPSTGEWYVLRSSDNSYFSLQWGLNGDIPIPSAYIPQ